MKNVLAAKYKTAEIVEWINQKGEGRLLRTTRETTSKSSVVTLHVPDVAAAIENLLEQTRAERKEDVRILILEMGAQAYIMVLVKHKPSLRCVHVFSLSFIPLLQLCVMNV